MEALKNLRVVLNNQYGFLGLARGFKALHEAGLIERFPRLFAAQSAGCDPIVRGWEDGLDDPPSVTQQPSVADGITTANPVRGREVLAAIRESEGAAFRVDDEAALAAQAMLAGQGLYVEPTSAVAVAALGMARALMDPRAEFVVPLTGNGLKAG